VRIFYKASIKISLKLIFTEKGSSLSFPQKIEDRLFETLPENKNGSAFPLYEVHIELFVWKNSPIIVEKIGSYLRRILRETL